MNRNKIQIYKKMKQILKKKKMKEQRKEKRNNKG